MNKAHSREKFFRDFSIYFCKKIISSVSRKSDQRSHEKIEPSSSQFPESPLDLSNHKMPSVEPIERCGRSNESASTSEHVLESDSSKKRTVADAALVRLPLSLG